jgi:hypothetical protein
VPEIKAGDDLGGVGWDRQPQVLSFGHHRRQEAADAPQVVLHLLPPFLG